MTSKHRHLGPSLGIALATGAITAPAVAGTRGMVAATDGTVTVFDADDDQALVTLPLPGARSATGDCSITPDGRRGFVTDFTNQVHVVDLTTSPPRLAAGRNAVLLSQLGEDTSLSPDGRFLLVCDGAGGDNPVSVVRVASRKEASTFDLGFGCNSVEVCSDRSVLVTSVNSNVPGIGTVRRLELDQAGRLTDTGESFPVVGPNNVFCAPGGTSAVVITRDEGRITSLRIPGLVPVDDRLLAGSSPCGISGLVSPDGNRVFTRDNDGTVPTGFVQAFAYDAHTGALGNTLSSIPIARAPTLFGVDQMAIHPNGEKLYVSQPSALFVYDARQGTLLTSIPLSATTPTGVCLTP